MNVIAIITLIVLGLGFVLTWGAIAYNATKKRSERDKGIVDIQAQHAEEIKSAKIAMKQFSDLLASRDREYAGYFEGIRIRLAEFTSVKDAVNELKIDVEKLSTKADLRDEKRDTQMQAFGNLLHEIHITVAKNTK
jgi:hypothetical protein